MYNKPLQKRLSQAVNGRFLRFAPISYHSPQKSSNIHAIYQVAADADTATISVQDFGIGIAQEQHEHVFDRFFRVSNPEAKTFPGLGLGLFISAQIVRRHGGRIWVDSQEGEGSTFSFSIPLRVPSESDTRQEAGGKDHP